MRKVGLIKEEKFPLDRRVALTPSQAYQLMVHYDDLLIKAASSPHRCFSDAEYREMGVPVKEHVHDCEILLGVKEVPPDKLLPNKTYLFFSHTIKKQPHNKKLLQEVLRKNIRLIDYECLTDEKGERIIAFGRFAGIIGAHNALWAYGQRTGSFSMPRAFTFGSAEALFDFYQEVKLPPVKIVITGGGRVAQGAIETMRSLNIRHVAPSDFLNLTQPAEPIYVQLDTADLYRRKDGQPLQVEDFYHHPSEYICVFKPYYESADIMINGIYWHPEAPRFFTKEEMKLPAFRIKTISDISCDINGSVPATLRSTTIENPVMGYNPITESEEAPYQAHVIDIISIDNLPNELPRDASEHFGEKLRELVLPELLQGHSVLIERATIARHGQLTERFSYLADYVA